MCVRLNLTQDEGQWFTFLKIVMDLQVLRKILELLNI
jgi:hypothetical protein